MTVQEAFDRIAGIIASGVDAQAKVDRAAAVIAAYREAAAAVPKPKAKGSAA